MKNFKFGVLGHNISYSLSPKIFDTIFDYANINGSSEVLDWDLNQLEKLSKKLTDYDGLSITIPYKQEILRYLDRIEEPANIIRSVNSIHNNENILIGYNTDYKGFLYPLQNISDQLKNNKVLLFGLGGSARAVIYSLASNFKLSQIDIVVRNIENSEATVKEIINKYQNLTISLKKYEDKIDYSNYKLIINSTPLGSAIYQDLLPFEEDSIFDSDSIYFDLNYNKGNKAIICAEKHGVKIIDSKQMLVAQAIESFRIWTSIDIPFDEIYRRVF